MARSFNGTSQALQAPSVNLSGGNVVSLSFWAYFASLTDGTYWFEFSTDMDAVTDAFYFRTQASTFILAHLGNVGYNQGNYSTSGLADGWHHYVALYDKNQAGTNAGEIDLYIDGSIASKTAINSSDNTNDFGTYTLFMMESGGGAGFSGDRLADVAVWNIRLTEGQITSLAGGTLASSIQTSNLKGYWKICGDESPEPDSSSENHDATLVGAPAQVAHPATISGSCAGATPGFKVILTQP